MISEGIEVNWFVKIRLILEERFGDDPLALKSQTKFFFTVAIVYGSQRMNGLIINATTDG